MPRRITGGIAAVAFGLATFTATGAHAADDATAVAETTTVVQSTSDDARTKEERVHPARTKEERDAALRTKEE
ncbi:hypothetical protein [Nocardioides antri]|uniref:Uncharacterized protein n=1 Tax=Nocardioides antri TaxID=2607659 RepID=A0A5B1LUI9_9ACTN|nr:hypothetical protein [Nocardioides antri]KAA1424333.1 hypothetical protein F0U47_19055 [Nocardioides antri]